VTLFERLRAAAAERDIDLRLVHGQPSPTEALKKDVGSLPWSNVMCNRFWRVRGVDLIWQPFPPELRDADLVVLIQENRILSNYPWLLRWGVRPTQRVGYWGHGRNLQSANPNGFRERWKRWFVNRVDWWFAYTETTRDRILVPDGFPRERITVLNNAIDNDRFLAELAAVTPEQRQACRDRLGVTENAPVGLYCGSLYADKRLDLMLAAADIVHAQRPDFRLVVIGDGPSRPALTDAAATRPWLHWAGAQHGPAKAAWFRAANSYLSPGAVGLHVLDAFCAGLPMITTANARHGPEIAYLESGRNGFVVEDRAETFASTLLGLMGDPQHLASIRDAAASDAERYSLANMVRNFVQGLEACLAMPPKGW
jgi:glycosyltransferase involved in cell wall biosynthesis